MSEVRNFLPGHSLVTIPRLFFRPGLHYRDITLEKTYHSSFHQKASFHAVQHCFCSIGCSHNKNEGLLGQNNLSRMANTAENTVISPNFLERHSFRIGEITVFFAV